MRNRFAPLENDVSSSRPTCKNRAFLNVVLSKHNPLPHGWLMAGFYKSQVVGPNGVAKSSLFMSVRSVWTGQSFPRQLAAANAPGRVLTRLLARGVTSGPELKRACTGRRKAQGVDAGATEVDTMGHREEDMQDDRSAGVQRSRRPAAQRQHRPIRAVVNRPRHNGRHQTLKNRQKTLAHSSLRGTHVMLKRFMPPIYPPARNSGGRIGGRIRS